MTPKVKPMSLRAFARRRDVSVEAVSKAVAARRLRESIITVGGAPKIADPELADREWEANTRARVDRSASGHRGELPDGTDDANDIPDYFVSRARREAAAARREAAQADLAELEVAQLRGELVSVAEARADMIDKYTIAKTRILGVPARLAQRLPHLADEAVPVVDALLREALEGLAVDDAAHGSDADDDLDDDSDGDDVGQV